MKRNMLWMVVSVLMTLSLVLAACGPAAPTTTTPPTTTPTTSTPPVTTTTATPTPQPTQQVPVPTTTSNAPKYGGILLRAIPSDPTTTIGPLPGNGATVPHLQEMWAGDWTKGNAGGFGTKETDWAQTVDRFDRKYGLIAEKTTWTFDAAKDVGTIVYTIRKGIHYQKVPNSAAAALVNGRELTADDVVFVMQTRATDPGSYVYLGNIPLRTANITKTGPWEVSVTVQASQLLTALNRFSSTSGYYPPEVFQKFNRMAGWRDQVGTGAFMWTDYVPGSLVKYTRNPDYWEKDPIGPGKGNQLPYLDGFQNLIIPDLSTRVAALRTGRIDTITSMTPEDALPLLKSVSALKSLEKTSVDGRGTPLFPRLDKPELPFKDVKVRRAMMLGIDFNNILQNYRSGKGQIITYPFADTIDYHDLYLGLNDPDMPASTKELFSYNPTKAKQLLAEAGYPNGFKTSVLLSTAVAGDVDYYSIIKDMWAKIGIELTLDLADAGTFANRQAGRNYDMTNGTTAPAATFYLGVAYQGAGGNANLGNLNDPVVNAALKDVNVLALTDLPGSMKLWREKLAKYVLDQAYAIPNVIAYNYNVWWPWLANYSGEGPVSYAQTIWPNYVWIDQSLKKSMGY